MGKYKIIYARQRYSGWDAWGNEVESDITLEGSEANGVCKRTQRPYESKK